MNPISYVINGRSDSVVMRELASYQFDLDSTPFWYQLWVEFAVSSFTCSEGCIFLSKYYIVNITRALIGSYVSCMVIVFYCFPVQYLRKAYEVPLSKRT